MTEADKQNWKLLGRLKRTAIEYLAVIISVAGFFLTALIALIFGIVAGVALFIAIDASENTKIWQIYVTELHGDLIEHGFEPPPLPGSEKKE